MVKSIKLNLLLELLCVFLISVVLTVTLLLFYNSFKAVSNIGQESDPLGNIGIGGTAPSDTTPPTVSVINPLNGASVSGIISVIAEASDSGGIANVSFYVDGASLGTDTSAPYSVTWDTTIYPHNSIHTLIANALDTSGNQASSSAVTVTVLDVTAPNVNMTNPLDGATVPKHSNVTITASASDISGIDRVEFYVNGVLKCTDTTFSYFCNWRVPPRKNITYTLQAKAYDIAGNINTSTVTVTSK